MNAVLEPILTDAITRFTKFNKPEPRDAARILGPALSAICLDAKAPAERAAEWLESQGPEAITEEAVRSFVRSVTEAHPDELAAARAKMALLNKEVSAKPLTEREKVLLERHEPLSERSRASIEAELWEARTGRIRLLDADSGEYKSGEKLPGIVRQYIAAREVELQAELDARDCRSHGLEYIPPAEDKRAARPDIAYLAPMRG